MKQRNCFYTFGNGCPGLMSSGSHKVQKRCKDCKEFNGNLGKFEVSVGSGDSQTSWKENIMRRFERVV